MKTHLDKNMMSASSHSRENTLASNNNIDSLESSIDNEETEVNSLPTLLPRSTWNSQVAYLRVLFRAKKALDRIEQEAGVLRS